jgi:hypothetical protein
MHWSAFERALRRVANQRIEEAMDQGGFDDLPGEGQPLELEPYDENWWVRKWAKRQNLSEPQMQRELRQAKRDREAQKQNGSSGTK